MSYLAAKVTLAFRGVTLTVFFMAVTLHMRYVSTLGSPTTILWQVAMAAVVMRGKLSVRSS